MIFFTKEQGENYDPVWIGRSLLLTMGIVVWISQPNLSTSIVMLVIWFSMLWVSGLKLKYLLLFVVLGVVSGAVSFPLLEEYQQQRIITFLFPDPEARYGDTYNIQHALISIGSGGLLGQGYGQGSQVQLRFLKVRWSDFIFSAMAQEFGFVGVVAVMLVLIFVILRCLRAARLAGDTFGALIAYGVATLLAFQTVVNIGVNLNLMPATGLTLPFCQLWGKFFALFINGCWSGGECYVTT